MERVDSTFEVDNRTTSAQAHFQRADDRLQQLGESYGACGAGLAEFRFVRAHGCFPHLVPPLGTIPPWGRDGGRMKRATPASILGGSPGPRLQGRGGQVHGGSPASLWPTLTRAPPLAFPLSGDYPPRRKTRPPVDRYGGLTSSQNLRLDFRSTRSRVLREVRSTAKL